MRNPRTAGIGVKFCADYDKFAMTCLAVPKNHDNIYELLIFY